ncbi:MAG: SDR family NAD(P)-dependent oxidoreductase [Planctomycetota bacterium]|jgi:3-oxoacyl-[acyl-carrier protein] reductase
MNLQLDDLTVLVTGASGGIGRAIAEGFAAEGAFVVLHAGTRGDELRTWAEEQDWADRSLVVEADVREPEALQAAVDHVVDERGRIDACVPCAGIWPAEAQRLDEMDGDRLRDVLDVNLQGTLWACRAFLMALARTGPRDDGRGACIVLIGSTAGRFGEAGHVAYAASKAALRGVLLTLKNEIVDLDPGGRVNLVEPGWTVTDMTRGLLDEPGALDRVTRTAPLRRTAEPLDVANAVAWLASPAARHITGETLTVAGGMEGRVLRDV